MGSAFRVRWLWTINPRKPCMICYIINYEKPFITWLHSKHHIIELLFKGGVIHTAPNINTSTWSTVCGSLISTSLWSNMFSIGHCHHVMCGNHVMHMHVDTCTWTGTRGIYIRVFLDIVISFTQICPPECWAEHLYWEHATETQWATTSPGHISSFPCNKATPSLAHRGGPGMWGLKDSADVAPMKGLIFFKIIDGLVVEVLDYSQSQMGLNQPFPDCLVLIPPLVIIISSACQQPGNHFVCAVFPEYVQPSSHHLTKNKGSFPW